MAPKAILIFWFIVNWSCDIKRLLIVIFMVSNLKLIIHLLNYNVLLKTKCLNDYKSVIWRRQHFNIHFLSRILPFYFFETSARLRI